MKDIIKDIGSFGVKVIIFIEYTLYFKNKKPLT